MKTKRQYAVALLILLAMGGFAYGQTQEIILDGQNAPGWNKKLGVTAIRGSCNLSPEECVASVAVLLKGQNVSRFYLNILDDPKTIVTRTTYYSKASLSQPGLVELDIDDFVDHFNGWCKATPGVQCDKLLGEVIAATKSNNPALKFGLTIYEDQLDSLLANPRFTPALRDHIDTVHLALHQRQNGPRFESYVNIVNHKLPNAKVIAGSYHSDRIDYIKCGNVRCSAEQEFDLYKQTLKLQLTLLEHKVISGIEFYPGYFGMEEKWKYWDDPRICASARKQQCIENSNKMDLATVQLLNEFGIGIR